MVDKDLYDLLGISKWAMKEEIKKAFRDLSKKMHPDVNKEPDAEDQFKAVNKAYMVLSDPEKKKRYDLGDEEHENTEFKALRAIKGHYMTALEELLTSLGDAPIARSIKDMINTELKTDKRSAKLLNLYYRKLQKCKNKVVKKNDKDSIFVGFYNERLRQTKKDRNIFADKIKVNRRALKIMNEYFDKKLSFEEIESKMLNMQEEL